MENFDMKELVINFNMVKENGQLFTDDEIDEFNDEFISLVEKHGYLVGGGIGPYNNDMDSYEDIDDSDLDDNLNEDENYFMVYGYQPINDIDTSNPPRQS